MSSKAGKQFGQRLFSEIEEARGVEHDGLPTPPVNAFFNEWIRGAIAGQRGTEAVAEVEPDTDSPSYRMSNWIRGAARPADDEG